MVRPKSADPKSAVIHVAVTKSMKAAAEAAANAAGIPFADWVRDVIVKAMPSEPHAEVSPAPTGDVSTQEDGGTVGRTAHGETDAVGRPPEPWLGTPASELPEGEP